MTSNAFFFIARSTIIASGTVRLIPSDATSGAVNNKLRLHNKSDKTVPAKAFNVRKPMEDNDGSVNTSKPE